MDTLDDNSPISISAQILVLQTRHRELDAEIEQMYQFPYVDQLKLQRLKKQKLRLKEHILRLKDSLIPDLDA